MTSFDLAASAIIDAGQRLDARGWAMGGSGNYSVRLEDGTIAVTVSGRHKGRLQPGDVMRVDHAGQSLDGKRPSAETQAHTAIYRSRPQAGAILHTHSVAAAVLTRLDGKADHIAVSGYEMQKAVPGFLTHESRLALPVLENDQDMERFGRAAEVLLRGNEQTPGFLIRGHGLYTWGASMHEAVSAIEGLEYLLACELEMRRCEPRARHD